MQSRTNGNQRDRVASYAGGMLNRVNGGGPSIQVPNKKKPYRARGCRGGASRKGRSNRKNQSKTHSRQNEENDPSRLNNNLYAKDFDRHDTRSDNPKVNTHVFSDNKARTLSILPTESTIEIDLIDQSRQVVAHGMSRKDYGPKSIPTDVLHTRGPTSATKGATLSGAIARPASISFTGDGSVGGGFSFFCISPRSFLSGRKARR